MMIRRGNDLDINRGDNIIVVSNDRKKIRERETVDGTQMFKIGVDVIHTMSNANGSSRRPASSNETNYLNVEFSGVCVSIIVL